MSSPEPTEFVAHLEDPVDGIQRLSCRGELDLLSADRLKTAIRRSTAPLLLIDLSDVPFIDSSGIAALVAAHRRHPDGRVAVCCPPGAPRRALALTGMHELLLVRDTTEQAARALDERGGEPERLGA